MIKKIIVYLICLLFIQKAFSQSLGLKAMLKKIASEKNVSIKIDLIYELYFSTVETDPALGLQNAKELLKQSRKNKDRVAEAMALFVMGANNRLIGKPVEGLQYNLKALSIAEPTGNLKAIAAIKNSIGNIYKDQTDYSQAITYYKESKLAAGESKENYKILSYALMNLGEVYLAMENIDSAMIYLENAKEKCREYDYYQFIGSICTGLGEALAKRNNKNLADSAQSLVNFRLGLNDALKTKKTRHMNWAYTGLAQYFFDNKICDSCLIYAKQAINVVQNTKFISMAIRPSKLIADLYENENSDSCIKYWKIYRLASDSLFCLNAIKRSQLLTFKEGVRKEELKLEELKLQHQRKLNIQYALIALSIVGLLTIYLVFSLNFITKEKYIKFLGMVSLLIVFEFLNLLIHPFLENVTNHSPVLMLIGLVMVAAFLIPLHHKIERKVLGKLVKKNRIVQLSRAIKQRAKSEETIKNLGARGNLV